MSSQDHKKWRERVYKPFVDAHGERKSHFRTSSGDDIEPLYTGKEEPPDSVGFPGTFPFTRGVYPSMYRGRPWTVRQYAGFGTAQQTNQRFHYLLERGQKGLSVAFDLPTQMGLDSDATLSAGEVGRVGVAIDTVDDMDAVFDRIPLENVSTSMTINATASILLAMYVTVAEERGLDPGCLTGTVQNDILKEYIARGTYIFPPRPSVRLITDTLAWCATELPRWNPISISGYHIREAGATAAQELAFTLGDGVAYVEAGVAAGLDVDAFAPRLSFFFNVHNNFLEEVAKFRAARRMWAHIMKDRFSARNDASLLLRFHAQTAGSTLTAQQPDNNVARVAMQALAAVLGGTQSLHTNSMDEALGLPSGRASRIALRTQQIILEESGITDTIDPLGGSFAIEALTDAVEARALAILSEIDDAGGMIAAIDAGHPQREIERASYDFQKSLERGEQVIVGLNAYTESEVSDPALFEVDPVLEREQVDRVQAVRAARDSARSDNAIAALASAAATSDNLMPFLLESVRARVTVGEICTALAAVFGRYRDHGAR